MLRVVDLRVQFYRFVERTGLDLIKLLTILLSLSALLTTCRQNVTNNVSAAALLAVNISTEYNRNHDWFADMDKFVPIITGVVQQSHDEKIEDRRDRIRIINYAAYVSKLAISGRLKQDFLSDDLNCLIVNLAEMHVSSDQHLPIGTQFDSMRAYVSRFAAKCVQSGVVL